MEYDEIYIDAQQDYPKRTKNIKYLQPIRNYTKDLFDMCDIDITSVSVLPLPPLIPPWDHICAYFDIDYSHTKKEDNPNLLVTEVKKHIESNYKNHMQIFTDGSVLDSLDSGSAYIIPEINIWSYYLGKRFSILTAELFGILMALNFIMTSPLELFDIFRVENN